MLSGPPSNMNVVIEEDFPAKSTFLRIGAYEVLACLPKDCPKVRALIADEPRSVDTKGNPLWVQVLTLPRI